MKACGIQFDIAWEDPENNFARLEPHLEAAVAAGCDLVVLPEMFATGFSMKTEVLLQFEERIVEYLAEIARRYRVWVIAGVAGVAEVRPRNYALVFDRDGREAARFAKIHPFGLAREHEHFDGGTALVTVTIEGVRVTPLICYDLRFAEPFRAAASETDLFVVIANWPDRRGDAWRTLTRARAIENQAWLLAVNRIGDAEGISHGGDSALFDPLGAAVDGPSRKEGLVGGEVDAAAVAECREGFSFLADRRPAVYKHWSQDC